MTIQNQVNTNTEEKWKIDMLDKLKCQINILSAQMTDESSILSVNRHEKNMNFTDHKIIKKRLKKIYLTKDALLDAVNILHGKSALI